MDGPVEAATSPIPAWIIREATPADAAALITYVKAMLAGPEANMPLASDEFAWTVEAEQDNLAEMAAADNSLVLLAVADDQIIGELSCGEASDGLRTTLRCWACPSTRTSAIAASAAH